MRKGLKNVTIYDIMLKDGDLLNLSKVGLNMCFTVDLYHWKSNFKHFALKFTGLAKNTNERFYGKKEICTAKYAFT